VEINFRYLLIALLVFLLAVPFAFDLQLLPRSVIRSAGFSVLLAIGILSLRNAGRIFRPAIAFVVLGIALNILDAVLGDSVFFLGSLLFLLAFLILATFASMKQIAVDNVMSANRIVGAICVYLLLGVIWSVFYALLEFVLPGSFAGIAEESGSTWNPDWIYYSFVTLTTVGYGDMLPLTFSARALSYIETIFGQFYLAILVAGLVSAYLSSKQGGATED
jgi:voltage-gated potassium channel